MAEGGTFPSSPGSLNVTVIVVKLIDANNSREQGLNEMSELHNVKILHAAALNDYKDGKHETTPKGAVEVAQDRLISLRTTREEIE